MVLEEAGEQETAAGASYAAGAAATRRAGGGWNGGLEAHGARAIAWHAAVFMVLALDVWPWCWPCCRGVARCRLGDGGARQLAAGWPPVGRRLAAFLLAGAVAVRMWHSNHSHTAGLGAVALHSGVPAAPAAP